VRLERHVGGLSRERRTKYLRERGWSEETGQWRSPEVLGYGRLPLSKALHHQLTADLSAGLALSGWTVESYSDRGYARMVDPLGGSTCSLPAALRRQARREKRLVGEFTYALFLGALLD
jgi:hypothetical protein